MTSKLPVGFSPMLSAKTDDAKLKKFFDGGGKGLASVKIDGIRAIPYGGVVHSRKGIPIPNLFVQHELSKPEYHGLDGELIVGDPNDPDVYRKTNSAVMSVKGEPNFMFYVFDKMDWLEQKAVPFCERIQMAGKQVMTLERAELLEHVEIDSYDELAEFEARSLEDGYEGAMFRKTIGTYKWGRSTANEMGLMKLKRDADMELPVIRIVQAMHNANPAILDAFGRTKRSTNAENLVPLERAGGFVVLYEGKELVVAPGKFTHKELEEVWRNQEKYIGQLVKFTYFPHGMKDLPRHPRAVGWRDPMDV